MWLRGSEQLPYFLIYTIIQTLPHSLAPNSKILIVGEFWSDETKDIIKKQAASTSGATFIDLSPIQDDQAYQAGLGTEVLGDDGTERAIEHSGAAGHPGDKGMKWIGIGEAVVKGIVGD